MCCFLSAFSVLFMAYECKEGDDRAYIEFASPPFEHLIIYPSKHWSKDTHTLKLVHTENRRLLFYFDPFTASDRSKLLLALRDWVIDEWAAKEIPRPKQRKPSSSPVDPLIQAAFDGMEGKNNHGRSMRSERGCRSTQTLAPRASARPSLNERRYHPYSRTVAVKEPSARQVGPSEDATGKHESPPELVESVRMLQLSLPELTLEPPTFSSMTGG